MTTNRPDRVAVIGAGTIGCGWAALLLASGYRVQVYARSAGAEQRVRAAVESHLGALDIALPPSDRLQVTADLTAAVTGVAVVLESSVERLDVKRELFAAIERDAPADALLLSSTSALLPDAIGAPLREPGRVIVAHPFNPPHVIPLVEVLGGEHTDPALVARSRAFLTGLGRRVVVLRRPIAGFVANRLQTALLREAIHLVQQGVASVEDIDEVVTGSIGLRWATIGPFHALHLGGGPGGLRQWFEHIGANLAAGWEHLGSPELDQSTIESLIDQAEKAFGEPSYEEQVEARDARQLAILAARTEEDAGQATTTMINPIAVTGDRARFLAVIELISEYMASQDGFVGLRFYQSHAREDRYYMVAEWRSLEAHHAAAEARPPEVLSWFAELGGLTEVEPGFFATLKAKRAGTHA